MAEQTDIREKFRPVLDLEPPKDYKVIYVNDQVTTFDFVCDSLVNVFDYDAPKAEKKTAEIHEKGAGIVAVLPFEIAEQKGVEVLIQARNQGYPLEVKLEQE
jgi:ATP-dependent Clp protease adaptor protein ClpS